MPQYPLIKIKRLTWKGRKNVSDGRSDRKYTDPLFPNGIKPPKMCPKTIRNMDTILTNSILIFLFMPNF